MYEKNDIRNCKIYFWTAEIHSRLRTICVEPEDVKIFGNTVTIDPSLTQVNPVHISLKYCMFRIHLNIAFLLRLSQGKFRTSQ